MIVPPKQRMDLVGRKMTFTPSKVVPANIKRDYFRTAETIYFGHKPSGKKKK